MSSDLRIDGSSKHKTDCSSLVPASPKKEISSLAQAQLHQNPQFTPQPRMYSSSSPSSSLDQSQPKFEDGVLDIFKEVYGNKQKLPGSLTALPAGPTDLVNSYLSEEELELIRTQFDTTTTNFKDLTDPEVLKTYLGENSKSNLHLSKAVQIAKRIYEVNVRGVGKSVGFTKYGMAFPMNSEVLAHAMQLAKNETVLEIGGASGENGILLAFSGAKRVYVNDIDPSEMETFQSLKAKLPKDVRDKLEAIEGDCFEILKKKPEIANKIGLILCQNLLHFFTNKEQAIFFQLIKKMLKPGGQAIFVAGSIYSTPPYKQTHEENPDCTSYTLNHCLVTDYNQGMLPIANICHDLVVCPEHLIPSFTDFTTLYIYEKNAKTGFKWRANQDEFNKLNPSVRAKVKKAIAENKPIITPITKGSVRVLINPMRFYNRKTLPALFRTHGFEVESTFVVNDKGHLINDADLYNNGQQMGVIVKKS